MSAPYLERIKMASFGAFTNRVVGPFSEHLNVVFGQNEAGKTTIASFVGGVLFGWEEARGVRNTYKPANAERAGSLFFAVPKNNADATNNSGALQDGSDTTDEFDEIELSRVRNADGLQGDASIIADLDRETFNTMFSLTSDELRSLNDKTNMTAKLLTAGSGTGASPVQALAHLDDELATYTSRSANAEHSLVRLAAQQDEVRSQIRQASEAADLSRREDKEFHELAPQREEIMERLDTLNAEVEDLTARHARLEKLDDELEELRAGVVELEEEEANLARGHQKVQDSDLEALMQLSSADERTMRNNIDALTAQELKCEHAVDQAREQHIRSRANHEALLESEDEPASKNRRHRQRRTQIILSILLPIIFVAAGLAVVLYGRENSSVSLAALGVVIIVFAVLIASAAIYMLFRPNKEAEDRQTQRQKSEWVMLSDEKEFEVRQEELSECKQHIKEQLDAMGLAAADGSLMQARSLLDDAREARINEDQYQQHQQAFISRRTALEESLERAERSYQEAFEGLGAHVEHSTETVKKLLDQKIQQRTGLLEASAGLNRRYGELKQELSQAKDQRNFDELKLQAAELNTREEESARSYARLLLARRMLQAAIAAWESRSQPEVYKQASRLLSLMTDGKWVKVTMNQEGRIQVVDSVKTTQDPLRLSLGTCQQLYLALRIALLITAENVGGAVPILADDILVNFDAVRRVGAARALYELSQVRQVIFFTCHEEIVEALRAVDPQLNMIEL